MTLARIGLAAVLSRMGHVIKLDGRDDAGVGVYDQEVERQLANAIEDPGVRRPRWKLRTCRSWTCAKIM